MKKIILFILGSAICGQIAIAQTKMLTMEEAVVKQRTSLAPGKLTQLMWVKNSDNYCYVADISDKEKGTQEQGLLIISAIQKEATIIEFISNINRALEKLHLTSLKKYPAIKWKSENQFSFEITEGGKHYFLLYDLKLHDVTIESIIDENTENTDIADKTRYVAYTLKNNLFVNDGKNNLIV
ncbi:MAG: hypothetical protein ACXVDW_20705, partial [Bacteroidia bacterium]